MTGELHHLLLNHSLVGAGLPEQKPRQRRLLPGLRVGSPVLSFCRNF
jgi:2-dehydro-3-deoxygalactonokinase